MPDPDAIRDSYLNSYDPDGTYGASTVIYVGVNYITANPYPNRAITKYNLFCKDWHNLPRGAIISAVTLTIEISLVTGGAPGKTMWVRRLVNYPWTTASVSWNSRATGRAWQTPGGDYVTYRQVSFVVPGATGPFVISGLEVLAQDAVDNRNGILNLILMAADEAPGDDAHFIYRSGNTANALQRPVLAVTYKKSPNRVSETIRADGAIKRP